MGRGNRRRKGKSGAAAADCAHDSHAVASWQPALESAAAAAEDDDGWAVVGRKGRTLDEAAVQQADEGGGAAVDEAPLMLTLPPASREGGAGDTWAALHVGAARPALSVAPMMAWTDVHYRSLARMLSRRTLLWTEMIAAPTLLHAAGEGPAAVAALLAFPPNQHPIAVQIGGCDPKQMAAAAKLCVAAGYDEVGINVSAPHHNSITRDISDRCLWLLQVGCPSPTVASHKFGAVLMKDPHRTAAIASAVVTACGATGSGTATPVSLKHRLGVDDHDVTTHTHPPTTPCSPGMSLRECL